MAGMMRTTIKTFGGFDIAYGDRSLSEITNRRSKALTVMKYMIAHHKRSVSQEELIEILWPDEECSDPSNSLKNTIYQLRKLLSNYVGGIHYIVFRQGMYSWNSNVDFFIDSAEFESILAEARDEEKDVDERIGLYKTALALYRGEFLHGEISELWLVNFKTYFRRQYLNAVSELADLFMRRAAFEEIVALYNDAIEIEAYEETLYVRQIKILILIGEYARAKQQYKSIEKLLKKEFGAEPSSEFRSLWHEIAASSEKRNVDLTDIKASLEDGVKKSAIICGPETFKRVYSYDKCLDKRMHFPVFLGLISVELDDGSRNDRNGELLTVMKSLRNLMLRTLRVSDIICQYSANQYVLMITGTDEKNKMEPLTRIKRLFEKENDVAGVTLSVQATSAGNDAPFVPV